MYTPYQTNNYANAINDVVVNITILKPNLLMNMLPNKGTTIFGIE